MPKSVRLLLIAASLLAAGCVSVPTGPRTMALPGSTKTFDQFRADDWNCRNFARAQVGGNTPEMAANDSGVRSAVTGTALGAAAGAAISGGHGAAVGAGAGLLIGALTGTGYAHASAYEVQQRYDNGYVQCMYAQGHKVPAGRYTSAPAPRPAPQMSPMAPPSGYPPPPPPGAPPPPPPR